MKNRVAWGLVALLSVAVLGSADLATAKAAHAQQQRRLSKRNRRTAVRTHWKGHISKETDWICFCHVQLVSGKLLMKDASGPPRGFVLPPEWLKRHSKIKIEVQGELGGLPPGSILQPLGGSQTPYDLPPGDYIVAARCMQWGTDRRVSRLRVVLKGSSVQLGKEIGSVCTDTAVIGVFDLDVFSAAWRDHPEAAANKMEDHVTGEEIYSSFALDEQHRAVMAFAHTGFGDGGYPVYELLSGSKRVGVEVVFIKENEPYPF